MSGEMTFETRVGSSAPQLFSVHSCMTLSDPK